MAGENFERGRTIAVVVDCELQYSIIVTVVVMGFDGLQLID
jgi:hypothetical protein